MKILITGRNGFIARNLFEAFQNDYEVFAPNSKELDLLDSLKVFEFIKKNQFEVVIHTANYDAAPKYSIKDPQKVLENNLKMFFSIARCKDFFDKLIFFGSGAEFGRENWIPKMTEDYFDQNVPIDQYGFSKYIMTKYACQNVNIYNLRLFGIFGKYDDWRKRFIPNACCYVIHDLPIPINQNVFFDFLYINDLIRIVKWFICNTPRKNVYNVCTGKIYDLKTLAEKIVEISGKNLDIIIKKEGVGREYSGDNSLLLNELKNFKFSSMDDSIAEIYNWYNFNKMDFNKDLLE